LELFSGEALSRTSCESPNLLPGGQTRENKLEDKKQKILQEHKPKGGIEE
jgi:hypothetical protein